jgi:4-amino-4-deoxy-L-arabinose transferase-like glycosyltransferase
VAFLVFITLLLTRRYGIKGLGYVVAASILLSAPMFWEYSKKDSPFRARIKQYFHYRIDSFDSHFMLLTGTYQIFEKYPIIGGGYGGFFEHFSKTAIAPTYFGRDPAALNTRVPAHTIWGELIAETGILGLSIFVLMMLFLCGTIYYSYVKLQDWREYLIPAAMLSVIVGWLTAGIFYSYNAEFFWIVIGLYFTYCVGTLGNKYILSNILNRLMKSTNFYVVILAVLGAVLLFVGLGRNHLVPWDEAIYAKISKNMVVQNDFMVQRWWPDRVWYEKPPFYMWSAALGMKVLGFSNFAARLPSALFGLGTVLLVYWFGKRLFNKTAGYISAFALLTTIHFLYYSRSSMLDVTVTFFITLAIYLYYLAKFGEEKKDKYWLFSGIAVGLAIMTKGVVGFLPYAVVGLYELYLYFSGAQKFSRKLIISYAKFFGASVLTFLPWHLYMYFKFGNDFLANYIGYHVISRATSAIENKGKPFCWYCVVLKVSMRLWLVALLSAFPFSLISSIRKDKKNTLLVLWAVFLFLFFSAARSKLVWYIIPLYPALCLMVGHFFERFLNLIMHQVKSLNTVVFKFIFLYVFTTFGLLYFFYHKHMVYTADLTGSQARLLKLKDEKLGVSQRLFVDRVELPVVLFYTDGPFEIIDFNPDAGRYPIVPYNEILAILGKRGRFSEYIPQIGKKTDIVGEDGDWVLWHYKSDHQLDLERVKFLEVEIKKAQERPQTSAVLLSIKDMQGRKKALEEEIEQKLLAVPGYVKK